MDIIITALQILLAIMFLIAGFGKMIGAQMHVHNFNHWRLPQWFRVITGVVELVSGVALILGIWEVSWAAVGALLLSITAVGGVITHIRVKDSFKQTFPIIVFGLISGYLLLMFWSELGNFPGFN